jgi:hypothetical protein
MKNAHKAIYIFYVVNVTFDCYSVCAGLWSRNLTMLFYPYSTEMYGFSTLRQQEQMLTLSASHLVIYR